MEYLSYIISESLYLLLPRAPQATLFFAFGNEQKYRVRLITVSNADKIVNFFTFEGQFQLE